MNCPQRADDKVCSVVWQAIPELDCPNSKMFPGGVKLVEMTVPLLQFVSLIARVILWLYSKTASLSVSMD
jgi:hypothetical protein